MSDQKDQRLQYHTLGTDGGPDGRPHDDYPITPPPYSPFPDQNSYLPNPHNPSNAPNPLIVANIDSSGHNIYSQPMPGFGANSGQSYPTNYGTIVQTVPQTIIFIGSCPACRVGVLEEDFTCLGILLALLFFPLGILCCFALRQRRCPNCGTTFE
ncbi:unnamed protein product [Medioppia subpectinata]|uniref:Membrane protein BRI3 n=1 Tax=Medioppia subpectinata TaxID=1979941 RepID=A0A7R9LEQ6_9ACAR|nr:unnamed protein product [Medioppia subpectinata]CAG2118113.1 unnamed protein product [Medioppia subpectinata]